MAISNFYKPFFEMERHGLSLMFKSSAMLLEKIKISGFFQQIFLTDLFLLQSSLKTSSNKQVNKRSDIKMASSTTGNQNTGMVKTLTSNIPATLLPQSTTPTVESKGADTIPEKSGKHVMKSINASESAEQCSFKKCLIGF